MKLSKRESMLLLILVVACILFVYFKFLIIPQSLHIEALQYDKESKIDEYQNIQALIASELSLDGELKQLQEEYRKKSSEYFPLLDQEEIIILLNEMLIEEGVKATKINFSEVRQETTSNNDSSSASNGGDLEKEIENAIHAMSVNLQYSSDYEALMRFFIGLREYNKKIRVDSFSIAETSEGSLTGDIKMDFYWMPHLNKEEANILAFPQEDHFKKDHPFASYVGYGGIREEASVNDTFMNGLKEDSSNMQQHIEYLVQKDDTLYSISLNFYNNFKGVEDIILYNSIKDRNHIEEGQVLFIPLK